MIFFNCPVVSITVPFLISDTIAVEITFANGSSALSINKASKSTCDIFFNKAAADFPV